MKYVKPKMELWKLKEEDIVTAVSVGGDNYSNGSNEGNDFSDLSGLSDGWD